MKKYIPALLLLILLDIVSKSYLLGLLTKDFILYGNAFNLVPHPVLISDVSSIFNIVFTWNPGTSFSMFRWLGENYTFIISGITFIIICFLFYLWIYKAKDKFEKISLLLIISGACGNLLDRIRFGAVIDFLDFHLGTYHWPAFNIADILICCGVMIYIYGLWIKDKKHTKVKKSK